MSLELRSVNYPRRISLMRNNKSRLSGFTLWEVLVVLFLMGVLLTSFTPYYGSASKHVRLQMNRANIQRIEGAAQLYKIDVGTYPHSVTDLVYSQKGMSDWQGPYLNEIPSNPFNSEQSYQLDSSGRVNNSSAN
ncbi:type II secretion system protein G (GspG) [Desulfosporosinus lacus DSM 15449]|uniref:Type II secretion system protein G (GspG) n=2 Tax=Desulfosporosinus TaxID=79206 RepID=A0A1M5Z054_9FIRM|nr:type II secretion system protein G (GspG) [Desulfosporosinus lacus DSM 15449]